MSSTISSQWNIKSASASLGRSRVGPALYVFSLLDQLRRSPQLLEPGKTTQFKHYSADHCSVEPYILSWTPIIQLQGHHRSVQPSLSWATAGETWLSWIIVQLNHHSVQLSLNTTTAKLNHCSVEPLLKWTIARLTHCSVSPLLSWTITQLNHCSVDPSPS